VPRTDEYPLLLPQVREDLRDYRIPGAHLHGPLALGLTRLPSGRLIATPGLIPPGAPGLGATLGVKLWPFTAKAQAGTTRSTVVSPPFTGPAMLSYVSLDYQKNSTIGGGISFFYSPEGTGQLDSGAVGTLPTGTPIFLPHSFHEATSFYIDEVREHLNPQMNDAAGRTIYVYPLGFLIAAPGPFFIKVSVRCGAVENVRVTGLLRLIEGVDPADPPF
jgi:hypothetical protein